MGIDFGNIEEPPWGQNEPDPDVGMFPTGWFGKRIALNEVSDTMPQREDVEEVLYKGEVGDEWDGETAAVVRLKDGRYMAWGSMYGPTGTGFSADAYGGDTNVYFSDDLNQVVMMALSDEMRRAIGYQPRELHG